MLISHPAENNLPAKPLESHLRNVAEKSFVQIIKMRLNLTILTQEELAELSYIIGLFHDFGKATTYFQDYINNKKKSDTLTHHSFVSALVCYYSVIKIFSSAHHNKLLAIIAYLTIKKHHGDLETLNFNDEINIDIAEYQIEDILNNGKELEHIYAEKSIAITELLQSIDLEDFCDEARDFEDFIDDYGYDLYNDQRIELFFITNLLFSVLIDNDKKDAARLETSYFDGNLKESVNDIFPYIEQCRKEKPEKYKNDIPINKIRNQFLNEIVNNSNIVPENHFYSITAPTGIGKTFGCLAFANQLKEKLAQGAGRIIYCLPYTSIIDQNFDEFEKIIKYNKKTKYSEKPGRYLLKHHHLMFKKVEKRINDEEYTYKDYLDDKLFVESWETSMVVTTFVQFFHTIIGYKNNFLKKFHNIINSIVILDEVQNIPPQYYGLLKDILHVLGKQFNIYFLLITATQPEIFDFQKSSPISLVDSKKYIMDPLFNRVTMKIDLQKRNLDDFIDHFCNNFKDNNCLIVVNTKKSAIAIYLALKKKKKKYSVFCLTTYLVPFDRKKKIEEIEKALEDGKKLIVISTQLIEAGVDLSFKNVYRDFGPLDSIIQVAGRCNRNCEYGEKGGEMTLVNLTNDKGQCFHSFVYEQIIFQYVSQTLTKDYYESKDFGELSKKYFEKFDFISEKNKLLNAIYELNYDITMKDQTPIKDFKLIKEYRERYVYILITQEAQKNMDKLLYNKESLIINKLSKSDKEVILFEIEKLKGKLKAFQISLRESELLEYVNTHVLNEKDYYVYIPYQYQKEYAYDDEIGFLVKPKKDNKMMII